MPSLWVILLEFSEELFHAKTRMMELSDGENRVILAWLFSHLLYTSMWQTDRRTDGRTDGRPMTKPIVRSIALAKMQRYKNISGKVAKQNHQNA